MWGTDMLLFSVKIKNSSPLTFVSSGGPLSIVSQSGNSSVNARGSKTLPLKICAPTSAPLSTTQTFSSMSFSIASCFSRMAALKPAGPAPTVTTSYSICSLGSDTELVEHILRDELGNFVEERGLKLCSLQRAGWPILIGQLPLIERVTNLSMISMRNVPCYCNIRRLAYYTPLFVE